MEQDQPAAVGNEHGNGAGIEIEGNEADLQGKMQGLQDQLANLQKFLLGGQELLKKRHKMKVVVVMIIKIIRMQIKH